MRNEDIIKHLMNIRDECLSSCEKAAVTEAIDIVNDYDKAAALSGRLTADYETGKQPVKMGENYSPALGAGNEQVTITRTAIGADS